jgi:pilus assembly protein Flp/PilA
MFSFLSNKNEEGQGLVEYALILVLVAVVSIVALALVGPAISDVYCETIVELGGTCDSGGGEEPPGKPTCANFSESTKWVTVGYLDSIGWLYAGFEDKTDAQDSASLWSDEHYGYKHVEVFECP